MKICWFGLLCLGAQVVFAREIHTWNTTAGGTGLDAAFLAKKNGQVALEGTDGQKFRVPIEQLSQVDRAYIDQLGQAGDDGIPAAIEAMFGPELLDAEGNPVSPAKLADYKKIGIYFSASWCPPCRGFTPKLIEAYQSLKDAEIPFEVVLVSSDRSEEAAMAYMKDHEMPWRMVPFGSEKKDALSEKFGVRGIPMLVIVNDSGQTLSIRARFEVTQEGAGAFDKW